METVKISIDRIKPYSKNLRINDHVVLPLFLQLELKEIRKLLKYGLLE